MIQNKAKKELNYYELRLKLYLKDYHPHLLGDEDFISARAEAAAEAHERAFLSGSTPYEAHHESIQVLLENLEFSPYLIIEDLLEEMGVPEEEIPTLALRLIKNNEVQSIIAEGKFSEESERARVSDELKKLIVDI